jgi:hypothetical protein
MCHGELSVCMADPLRKGFMDNSPPTNTRRLGFRFTREAYTVLRRDLHNS